MTEQPSRMLYDETDPDEIEDVSPELVEEDFDFGEFVAGVTATRKRVRIYPNGHLLAQVEELVERIEAADSDDESQDLLAEYDRLNASMRKSLVVVVEGRSTERLRSIRQAAHKAGVPNPSSIAQRIVKLKLPEGHPKRVQLEAEHQDAIAEEYLWQIADQIVHPTQGVTVESLRMLREKSEPELSRLFVACLQANGEGVDGLTPDFSPGRSGTRRAG